MRPYSTASILRAVILTTAITIAVVVSCVALIQADEASGETERLNKDTAALRAKIASLDRITFHAVLSLSNGQGSVSNGARYDSTLSQWVFDQPLVTDVLSAMEQSTAFFTVQMVDQTIDPLLLPTLTDPLTTLCLVRLLPLHTNTCTSKLQNNATFTSNQITLQPPSAAPANIEELLVTHPSVVAAVVQVNAYNRIE